MSLWRTGPDGFKRRRDAFANKEGDWPLHQAAPALWLCQGRVAVSGGGGRPTLAIMAIKIWRPWALSPGAICVRNMNHISACVSRPMHSCGPRWHSAALEMRGWGGGGLMPKD